MKKILLVSITLLLAVSSRAGILLTDDPTGFTATAVNDTLIDLNWSLNLAGDSVLLVFNSTNTFGIPTDGSSYENGNTVTGGGTVIYKGTGALFNHFPLAQNTTYYYKIFSFASGWIYSSGLTANATTLCSHVTGISEGFENGGNIPFCWTQEYVTGTQNWTYTDGNLLTNNPDTAFAGNFNAFFGGSIPAYTKTKLITPPLNLAAAPSPKLSFWAYNPGNDSLKIFYKTGKDSSWVLLDTIRRYLNGWFHYIMDLPHKSNDYYVAFEGKRGTLTNTGVCIDGTEITDGTCPLPNVTVTGGPICVTGSATLSGGISYIWYLSGCGYPVSSGTGASIFLSTAQVHCNFSIVATAHNSCGWGPSTVSNICASNPPFEPISTMSGNAAPCVGSTQTYTTPNSTPSPGCDVWSIIPTGGGWSIVSQNPNSNPATITVIVGTTNVNIVFRRDICAQCSFPVGVCEGTTSSLSVSPKTVPAQPSAITGQTNPCVGSSKTYSVTNVAGTTYNWSFPAGWTQTGGGTTNSVTVTVGAGSGNISVTPSNSCGNGTARTLAVSPSTVPAQPGAITGNNSLCFGTSQSYSVPLTGGVTYNWSFPAGWTQTGGGTTNSVTVTVGSGSGNITVTPSNTCGNGASRILAVISNSTAAAGISITALPSGAICAGSSVTFTATIINGGTAPVYNWLLNGIIVGSNLNTYSSNTLNNGDVLTCILTSNAPCASVLIDTSNAIVLNVQAILPVSISIAASANNICPDSLVTLTATPTNGGISPVYQWYLNSFPIGTNSNSYSSATWNNGDVIFCRLTSNLTCVSGNPDTSNSINMIVNSGYSFSENYAMCAGDNYTWHGTDYISTGTYNANYSNISGCDSIYTLHLTVNPVYAFTENHSICIGNTYHWQGNDYTTVGTYTANYTSINGCDSVYTLNLAVNPVYSFNENHNICNGDTYHWQGNDYTTANTYTANYTNINGCDSVYTLNLAVNPVYTFTENDSICNGDTSHWQGNNLTIANTYTANYTSVNGCDSIYTLNLFVNTVDTSLTVTDPVITANAIGASYQWLDCSNNVFLLISGATSQNYTAIANGDYAVAITQGACTDTSSCVQIISIGIASIQTEEISVFPNPTDGAFTITYGTLHPSIYIYNNLGKLIYEKGKTALGSETINLSAYSKGIYFVKIQSVNEIANRKLILQ